MAKNVCDVLLDVLAEAGVDRMYGIPGDAINSLTEAIRKQDRILFIQVRHEEAGAFAASAEAKLTGKLAVCVGTAGPGAIHLLNGLYDAKLDHAPVLAITGQVATARLGSSAHQEVNLAALFDDVSVFNQTLVNPEQLPDLAVHACQAALAHRGVAHLSLPVDLAGVGVPRHTSHPVFSSRARIVPCGADLDRAAKLLASAPKVAILAGHGALGATSELTALSDHLHAPVIKSLRGKELLPDEDPRCMGGLGLLGTRPAVKAMDECDALLIVGTDFPYPEFYPEGTPAVQIDTATPRLGRRYPVEVGLRGNAKETLTELHGRLDPRADTGWMEGLQGDMQGWWSWLERQEESGHDPLRPQRVAREIGAAAADNAIFVCDTGAVTVWVARHLRIRAGQRFTLSGGLASMAFGLPGAIGAQLAYPDRQVIALVGDGGFTMLSGDLVTAAKYDLQLKIFVFNNGKLGLIQMEQEVQGYPEFQTHLRNPDFVKLAEASGWSGLRVTGPSDLNVTIQQALALPGPVVVDVPVNPGEQTLPPKINAKQAFGYSFAKVREFLGQGDQGMGWSG